MIFLKYRDRFHLRLVWWGQCCTRRSWCCSHRGWIACLCRESGAPGARLLSLELPFFLRKNTKYNIFGHFGLLKGHRGCTIFIFEDLDIRDEGCNTLLKSHNFDIFSFTKNAKNQNLFRFFSLWGPQPNMQLGQLGSHLIEHTSMHNKSSFGID